MFRFGEEPLHLGGRRLFAVAEYTNRCGHGQEFISVPENDGWCQMIPVRGEAT